MDATKQGKLDNFEIYRATRQIADLICDIYQKHGIIFGDRRKQKPNPLKHQTSEGLFLERYYDAAGILWTPWGRWEFLGSSAGSAWQATWREIADALGSTLYYRPLEHVNGDPIGPVFAVNKVVDLQLPKALELERAPFVSWEEGRTASEAVWAAWRMLTERYESEGNS